MLRPLGTGEVLEKTSAAEALMQHLCYDAGIKPHDTVDEQAPPPAVYKRIEPTTQTRLLRRTVRAWR